MNASEPEDASNVDAIRTDLAASLGSSSDDDNDFLDAEDTTEGYGEGVLFDNDYR